MNERKIEFEGIRNCRDLGSLVTKDGKTIKKGKLIRSANLFKASDNDLVILEDMNLKKVVDLRSIREVMFSPDRYPENTEYVHNYIFAENRDGISHEKDEEKKGPDDPSKYNMINAYAHLMSEPVCIRHFGKALRIVMENDYSDGCVLWHCSEGKDRCGLLSAFVLTVLGVDEDTIREDYLLTNEVNGPRAEYFYHMYRENGRSEADCIAVRDVFLAKEEYLNVALKTIIDGYGSMDNFITEGMGISQELIDSFRAQILE